MGVTVCAEVGVVNRRRLTKQLPLASRWGSTLVNCGRRPRVAPLCQLHGWIDYTYRKNPNGSAGRAPSNYLAPGRLCGSPRGYLLDGQKHQDLSLAILETLKCLADERTGPMNLRLPEHHGHRAHRVTGRRTRHEQVTGSNRAVLRVHLHLDPT